MSFEVEGRLHKKFDTENKTDSFQVRDFVIEISSGSYPQMVKFQLTQDRCTIVDPFDEGDQLKVHFDLRGREWNEKYFTNLNAWRVEKAEKPAPIDTEPPPPASEDSFPTEADAPAGETNDDLPF